LESAGQPLKVIGLGPAGGEWLPKRNVDALRSASRVLLRTEIHPSTQFLLGQGIDFESCDDLYEGAESFDLLYSAIADRAAGLEDGGVFAVPGHPMVGEESVRLLAGLREIDVLPAPSFIDAVLAAARAAFSGPLQVWNAHDPRSVEIDPRSAQIVYQLDSIHAASEAKLELMRSFPEEHLVHLCTRAGGDDETVVAVPLAELDRQSFDPLTSVFVQGIACDFAPGFSGLVQIVDRLLGPGGCPWDREQTHESLKKHMVEETYEVLDAIDRKDPDALCEELGDYLLQAVMHAQMDAVSGYYDMNDVVRGISDKLVRRHPHVFGNVTVADSDEVLSNWDAIKKTEKAASSGILSGVPRGMPSLLRAHEISKRAARAGFEWSDIGDVFAKLDEEVCELRAAVQSGSANEIESEIGDALFTLVNVSRWLKIEPENALGKMVDRFSARFEQMEIMSDKSLETLSFKEWDELWNRAKAKLSE
jgi:tetrapyrrole methylase family protein/MazG family protein